MTVTLLFTDIERSTELVRELGDGYATTLGEHRRRVREACSVHAGEEIDCRGDEFSVAFVDASSAVAAAAAIQADPLERVRVRIGVHTGSPMRVEDSYIGLDVHRAARICAAGHGGQILLSHAARVAGVGDGLPVRDLGEHRLKGLPDPEQIFQLGPGDFPPLRTDHGAHGLGARKRVVLADDSVLLREGIARLLEDAGFELVGQSGNAEDLMRNVRSYEPDIAILDIRMPPTQTDEGLRAAQEIREKHPGTAVLLLSQYVESGYALELVADGAEGVGYLLKDRVSDLGEFVSAVNRVAEGGSALDPEVVAQLLGRRRGSDAFEELTPREREMLQLVAEGRSNRGIAARLSMTDGEVDEQLTGVFEKLRLPAAPDDRRLAAIAYLRT